VDLWQALRLPLLAVALSAAEEQLEEPLSGDSTKHHPMPLVPMPSPSATPVPSLTRHVTHRLHNMQALV